MISLSYAQILKENCFLLVTGFVTDISEVVYTLTDTQLIIEIDGVSEAYTIPVASFATKFSTHGPDDCCCCKLKQDTAAAAASHNVVITL